MSDKELKRLSVLQEICDQRITQSQAAQLLHISERQIRRLLQKYKAQGPAALAHAARGQTSNCKLRQGDLEYTQGQDRCDDVVEEARLHAPSASESPYSEEKWQDETSRDTHDEMPGHAGAPSAGFGTHRGDHR
jgi:hypothetical protein